MTVHYELPTASDFQALAGEHHPAVTIYASTAPIVSERERAETAVKSAFDEALDRLRADGEEPAAIDALKAERDRVISDKSIWSALSRSLAVFAAPGFNEVYVLPNRLDDAVHVGSHFTLGQLLRAPSQDQEAFAVTLSSNEWALWRALPTSRAEEMPLDPDLPRNVEDAANRAPGDVGTKRRGGHGDRGMPEEDRRPEIHDIYAKRVADAVWQELQAHDPDGKVPLFVFAAEPLLSSFMDRAHNGRRVIPVQGGPDRLNAAEIDEELRWRLAELNIHEAKEALQGLADGSAGRVERDLAAIGRMAAEGGVETLWFDFTTSVNGTLDSESGAIEFATGNGGGEALADGTRAGDILPQLAMMVLSRGGKVVTVRGDDLEDTEWTGPAVAELRFALT
ncbi:baeRF3 domain-containing protein [Agromyces sp. ZXT2-6]|uniref:baeRF3 domain-containing protein n=1 Tax=Agromyces sp. ZXT2-6 TaxID=3461153 RepID=UPI004055097F